VKTNRHAQLGTGPLPTDMEGERGTRLNGGTGRQFVLLSRIVERGLAVGLTVGRRENSEQ